MVLSAVSLILIVLVSGCIWSYIYVNYFNAFSITYEEKQEEEEDIGPSNHVTQDFTQDIIVKSDNPYLETVIQHKTDDKMFPYRMLCDENRNVIPIVLLAAFFRTQFDRERFVSYPQNGVEIVGITAYKTFPKPVSDRSGDSETFDDPFDYTKEIKNWIHCFRDPEMYGLYPTQHNLIEMSESDFYDPIPLDKIEGVEKKYDIIYSCLRDVDGEKKDGIDMCPAEGWNAINRNFRLAQACLPIMIQEFGLKVLIVGRVNCGLEEKYGDRLTIVDMLPYHEFQQAIRESRCLFVPNIYDASPRVVVEAMINNVPVLMNRAIVCGSKYIHPETGQFFTDEHDIRYALRKMQQATFSPRHWWSERYSVKAAGKKLRDFLVKCYPEKADMKRVKEVYFY